MNKVDFFSVSCANAIFYFKIEDAKHDRVAILGLYFVIVL